MVLVYPHCSWVKRSQCKVFDIAGVLEALGCNASPEMPSYLRRQQQPLRSRADLCKMQVLMARRDCSVATQLVQCPNLGTWYLTEAFADVAAAHDPTPFFLILRANFDPGFGSVWQICPDAVLCIVWDAIPCTSHTTYLLYTTAKPSAIQRLTTISGQQHQQAAAASREFLMLLM